MSCQSLSKYKSKIYTFVPDFFNRMAYCLRYSILSWAVTNTTWSTPCKGSTLLACRIGLLRHRQLLLFWKCKRLIQLDVLREQGSAADELGSPESQGSGRRYQTMSVM